MKKAGSEPSGGIKDWPAKIVRLCSLHSGFERIIIVAVVVPIYIHVMQA